MPALFCPLEPAWGDVATWMSGIATVLAAGVALWLGLKANAIAKATKDRADQDRTAEANVLLAYLCNEIVDARAHCIAWLQMAQKIPGEQFAQDVAARKAVTNQLVECDLPLSRSLIGRLHVLPAELASALGRAMGTLEVIQKQFSEERVARTHEKREEIYAAVQDFAGKIVIDLEIVQAAALNARQPGLG